MGVVPRASPRTCRTDARLREVSRRQAWLLPLRRATSAALLPSQSVAATQAAPPTATRACSRARLFSLRAATCMGVWP